MARRGAEASHLPCFLINETTECHSHTQHNKAPGFNEHEGPFKFSGSSVGSLVLLGYMLWPVEELPQLIQHVHLCLVEKDPEKDFKGGEK